MSAEERCTGCGAVLEIHVPRTVDDDGRVVACGVCPRLRLTVADRRFLRTLRIAVD